MSIEMELTAGNSSRLRTLASRLPTRTSSSSFVKRRVFLRALSCDSVSGHDGNERVEQGAAMH